MIMDSSLEVKRTFLLQKKEELKFCRRDVSWSGYFEEISALLNTCNNHNLVQLWVELTEDYKTELLISRYDIEYINNLYYEKAKSLLDFVLIELDMIAPDKKISNHRINKSILKNYYTFIAGLILVFFFAYLIFKNSKHLI